MRGTVPGLPSAHPLLEQLPGVYRESDFLRRFLGALDEILAPVLLALDNLPAHLHPATAPEDFLNWLSGWVAVDGQGHVGGGFRELSEEQRRAVVADAARRHQQRGTRMALAEAIRIETGVEPEISESGSSTWSPVAGAALPGSAEPQVTVRLRVTDPQEYERTRRPAMERLIASEVPAHVPYRVEFLAATEGTATG
ncbi:hypothetical protein N566_15455 [Streptomycetaceae bacterium MP113-05]|nr:hypothetical protein N566_15455 [Streptomycetaceae bacterium MP113-05]